MPNLWNQAAQMTHRSVLSALCIWVTVFSAPSLGLEISEPMGVQQMGQILSLRSTLSKIPEGAETQMRSACLKARMHSLENSLSAPETSTSSEVLVTFEPTIRQGGLLELRSLEPVNEAVVEVELVSQCPLIVFNTKWTLLMKQGHSENSNLDRVNPVNALPVFDLQSSSLLASSRKPPQPSREHYFSPKNNAQGEKILLRKSEDVAHNAVLSSPNTETPDDNAAVVVASLDAGLSGAGFIKSRKQTNDVADVLDFEKNPLQQAYGSTIQELALPATFGAAILLLIALLICRRYSRKKAVSQSRFSEPLDDSYRVANFEPADLASISREHVTAFSVDPVSMSAGNNRVLESLIGNEHQDFDADLNSPLHTLNSEVIEPAYRSSLKVSLELINRADIPGWKLPDSYLGLVESRNKSLELHRTIDALLLRSQIGLIELTFQDAKQGQSTPSDSIQDLLEQVLGEHFQYIETKTALCVPDVVKSYVRAKMCEIAGADKRQILRENLVNLNSQVTSPALCFGSGAWREFLSEEGILDKQLNG